MSTLQAALPAAYYVDDAHWSRERERVLHRTWFCAGRLSALGLVAENDDAPPQRRVVVDVAGESVVVTRDDDGGLHAFYNVCRHRGSQLVPVEPETFGAETGDEWSPTPMGAAPCRAQSLRCGYHSWTYDLAGRLLRAPHTDDVDAFDPAAFALHPVAADVWGGFLFLHLTPAQASPLAEALGGVPERLVRYPLADLVIGARLTYDVAANYKVVLENYNECYHCAGIHPELTRLVPSFGRGGTDLDWESGIPHRDGAWTFTASGTSDRAPFAGLDEHERVRHKGELLYPNLMLSLSADHVAAFTVLPLSAGRTRILCDVLFSRDEFHRDTFDPSDAVEFWDLVNKQDWAVCASVQRGMSSRAYTQGWFAPMEDASLDIRRWLLPMLGES